MKKNIRFLSLVTLISLFLIAGEISYAQPDPPQPPGQHGLNGNALPQSAPVGNGAGTLLILGFIYATMKTRQMRGAGIFAERKK